jgi:tetratricopeptide (TPR) repeat protein
MTAHQPPHTHHSDFPSSPRLFRESDPGGSLGHRLKQGEEEEEAKRWYAADEDINDGMDDSPRSATSSPPNGNGGGGTVSPPYLPTQVELALLCLDHLRDVRRYMASTAADSSLLHSEGKENRGSPLRAAARGGGGAANDSSSVDEKKDDNDNDGKGGAVGATTAENDPAEGEEDDFGALPQTMNQHYLTIAVWALQRAFLRPPLSASTDPYTDTVPDKRTSSSGATSSTSLHVPPKKLPSIRDMEGEVLVPATTSAGGDESIAAAAAAAAALPYEYDDNHASNVHRYYRNHGLSSGGGVSTTNDDDDDADGPLSLGELVAAGLSSLEARSRSAAENELCQSVLFQQFVSAVTERGFFDGASPGAPTIAAAAGSAALANKAPPGPSSDSESSHYQEKFQKVVAKFRTKLACQADASKKEFTGDWLALTAAEQYGRHVRRRVRHHKHPKHRAVVSSQPQPRSSDNNNNKPPPPSSSESRFPSTLKLSIEAPSPELPPSLPKMFFVDGPSPLSAAATSATNNNNAPHSNNKFSHNAASTKPPTTPTPPAGAAVSTEDLQVSHESRDSADNANDASLQAAAEALKNQGNVHMQQREFELAADCYTKAIQLCPSGPTSHVYYSNRAAALVSIRQFHLAIADSHRSLALRPDYGKAHARLGLAHFLLGQYELAVRAYTESLRYEPDNRSSKNYLDKATRRLADQREQQKSPPATAAQQQSAMGMSSVGPNKAAPAAGRLDPAGVASTSQTPPPPPRQRDASRSEQQQHRNDGARSAPSPSGGSSAQQQQAEKHKARGNQFMVQREYGGAYEAYTRAIELAPDGPQSHVYYSNRAAALCYLERYREAEIDSLRSLRLVPGYGKAHARLGLSRFFVGDYEGAVASYRLALEHDPDNAASKSYLLKAQAKLQQQRQQQEQQPRGKE